MSGHYVDDFVARLEGVVTSEAFRVRAAQVEPTRSFIPRSTRHRADPTWATVDAARKALDTTTHDWINRIGVRIAAVEADKERDCE